MPRLLRKEARKPKRRLRRCRDSSPKPSSRTGSAKHEGWAASAVQSFSFSGFGGTMPDAGNSAPSWSPAPPAATLASAARLRVQTAHVPEAKEIAMDSEVFELAGLTDELVVLKANVDSPLTAAMHPYAGTSDAYVTVARGNQLCLAVTGKDWSHSCFFDWWGSRPYVDQRQAGGLEEACRCLHPRCRRHA